MMIYGKGQKLYSTPLYEAKKKLIADFSGFKISNITRIAISPDGKKLAIVAESK